MPTPRCFSSSFVFPSFALVGLALLAPASAQEGAPPDTGERALPDAGPGTPRFGVDGGAGEVGPADSADEVPVPGAATVVAGAAGDQLVAPAAGDPHFLGFAAGPYFPPAEERLDPRLIEHRAMARDDGRERPELYAFVLFGRRMTAERLAELEDLGVRWLGFHPHHAQRAAIPMDSLERVAAHPAVRWLGFARPWQKVHPALTQHLEGALPSDVFDVTVSVFESDLGPASRAVPVAFAFEGTPGAVSTVRTDVAAEELPRTWHSHGWQQRALERAGFVVDQYLPTARAFRIRMQPAQLDSLLALDFVQFVEPVLTPRPMHDESTPMILADRTRAVVNGGTNAAALAGVTDSGVDTFHEALDHFFWYAFSWSGAGNQDACGHGSHVAGTMLAEPPVVRSGNRGVAPGLGWGTRGRFAIAKIFEWDPVIRECVWLPPTHEAVFLSMRTGYRDAAGNRTERPHVVNASWGIAGRPTSPWIGSEAVARTIDDNVVADAQLWVFAAGNDGSGTGTIGLEASAKNAFSVGSVVDYRDAQVGDPGSLWRTSSRGPCGDGRWKPNVVAPGRWIRSVQSGTGSGYVANSGTSMAAPHVTGVAAQLADAYSFLRYEPVRMGSLLMATASTKGGQPLTVSTEAHLREYGAGRVDAYHALFADSDSTWTSYAFPMGGASWFHRYADFTVPVGTQRMIVCMRYHEAAASAGASRALVNDLDMYLDQAPIDPAGNSGEFFAHQSAVDNTEIRILDRPNAGAWRCKIWPQATVPGTTASVSVTIVFVTANPRPDLFLSLSTSERYVQPGETVQITASVDASDHFASAVFVDATPTTSGLVLDRSSATLMDGAVADFLRNPSGGIDVALGDVLQLSPRTVRWDARWSTEGHHDWRVDARADNAANTPSATVTVTVDSTPPGIVGGLRSTTHTPGVWSNDPHVAYAWTAAGDALSGLAGYGTATDSSRTTPPAPIRTLGPVTGYSEVLSSDAAGRWFKIRAVDRSGNWSPGYDATGPYLIDTVEPGLPGALRSTSHTPGIWSNDPTVDFAWTAAADAHSGVDGYGEAWGNFPGVSVAAVRDMGPVTTRTATFGTSLRGFYYALRTVDRAGNWSSGSTEVGPYFIDAVPPTDPSGLASPTHAPGVWSPVRDVVVTWLPASDPVSGLAGYDVAWDHDPSTTLAGTTVLAAGATSATATLGNSPAGWWFHVAAVDVAGNVSNTVHLGPFFVDSSAPDASLTIDGGAEATTATLVTLTIGANDPHSPVTEMRFRNEGGPWSPWEPFATTRAWDLNAFGGGPPSGTRTVSVQVRNAADRRRLASDAIFLHRAIAYLGAGCSGSLGVPTFDVLGIPGIGRTLNATVGASAASTAVLYLGVSATSWAGLPLPLDLGFLGSPGCALHASLDVAVASGPPGVFPLPIPDDLALVGATVHLQPVLLADPSGRPVVTTRAATVTFAGR